MKLEMFYRKIITKV